MSTAALPSILMAASAAKPLLKTWLAVEVPADNALPMRSATSQIRLATHTRQSALVYVRIISAVATGRRSALTTVGPASKRIPASSLELMTAMASACSTKPVIDRTLQGT